MVATRLFAVLMILALGSSSCSSTEGHPTAFGDMSRDEVGCTVEYGDDDLYVIGPLGPGDSENVEPNDYTSIRLRRTAEGVVYDGITYPCTLAYGPAIPVTATTIDDA